MTDKNRPLVRVAISSTMLFDMMMQGWKSGSIQCVDGLPHGAKFVSSYFDADRHLAFLLFEHESFPHVSPGEIIPERSVRFERIGLKQKAG